MSNLVKILAVAAAMVILSGSLMAQTATPAGTAPEVTVSVQVGPAHPLFPIGRGIAAIGAGLVALAGGIGIGRLAASALDGMARQPEAAGAIQVAMLIAAALIEGFVFFGIFVCWYT